MDGQKGGDIEKEVFKVGLHEPSYQVQNLRHSDERLRLGLTLKGEEVTNDANFPHGPAVHVRAGEPVYEIPNPFPFWGTTYILKWQADRFKQNPHEFRFKRVQKVYGQEDTLFEAIIDGKIKGDGGTNVSLADLPRHILLSLAQNSKSAKILCEIARLSCKMEFSQDNTPQGLFYADHDGHGSRPVIYDKALFEVVANNPHLPDTYKRVMVLNPGAQGQNPIVGEYKRSNTHVWEYLRKNSYIPWGHYASNMAHDAVRYSVDSLSLDDINGLRFLYYQRVYVELGKSLGIPLGKGMTGDEKGLEELRLEIMDQIRNHVDKGRDLPVTGNLWGWNYGFGYASSGYRLHASHQQIHNQYALVPARTSSGMPTYIVGDLVWDYVVGCKGHASGDFFDAYIRSIQANQRTDGGTSGPRELIIFEDENVMAYCPKAQRSQGEVHLMAKRRVGNVIEADTEMRSSLDRGILQVMKALSALGAEMITVYEVSKRYHRVNEGQRLFYCFLPRHEDSPGSMSEAQGRWITGHYPEDFAHALKEALRRVKMA